MTVGIKIVQINGGYKYMLGEIKQSCTTCMGGLQPNDSAVIMYRSVLDKFNAYPRFKETERLVCAKRFDLIVPGGGLFGTPELTDEEFFEAISVSPKQSCPEYIPKLR